MKTSDPAVGSTRLVLHSPLIMTVVWLALSPLASWLLGAQQAAGLTVGLVIGAWGYWGIIMMQNEKLSD